MKYMIYLSSSVNLMTDDQLIDILKVSRKNNERNNLTGILLYADGTFLQVLEGEAEKVDRLFEIIEKDDRHKGIIKMISKPMEERNFGEWSMGFLSINKNKTEELLGYLKNTDEIAKNENKTSVITILKTFIEHNHLSISN